MPPGAWGAIAQPASSTESMIKWAIRVFHNIPFTSIPHV